MYHIVESNCSWPDNSPSYRFRIGHKTVQHTKSFEPKRGLNLTNKFMKLIQIWWNIDFEATPTRAMISIQYFAFITIAILSCYVQNCGAITSLAIGCEQNELSKEFKLRWKIFSDIWPMRAIIKMIHLHITERRICESSRFTGYSQQTCSHGEACVISHSHLDSDDWTIYTRFELYNYLNKRHMPYVVQAVTRSCHAV